MKRGFEDFARDLEKLEAKVRTKAIKQAQKLALRPLAQAIKQDAPEATGELKSSIKTKAGPRRKGLIITEVVIKTPEDNPHAGRVEFGTRETPADPFIRPNAKAMKPDIVESMAVHLDQALSNP